MTMSNFAQRHGYQAEQGALQKRDYLPKDIRQQIGLMMVDRFVSLSDGQLFVHIIQESLPPSSDLWKWYSTIPAPQVIPQRIYGVLVPSDEYDYSIARHHLVIPLKDCHWQLFYTIIERIYSEWRRAQPDRAKSLAYDVNLLLRSYGIPWVLQSGWVIPADDHAFVDELKYVRQVGQSRNAEDLSDPLVSLRNAFDALYRKRGGPDITGACNHAWVAWETAREAAGGVEVVRRARPELWRSLTEWRDLIHAGRHPGKKLGRPPTEAETGFIVRLCANAVRLVSTSLGNDENF